MQMRCNHKQISVTSLRGEESMSGGSERLHHYIRSEDIKNMEGHSHPPSPASAKMT